VYLLQLMTGMDDLIEWFVETERQIADAESLTSDLDKLREQQRDHKVIYLTVTLLPAFLSNSPA
jgi:hypothetical protein